jgi:uncharacterized membrane protein (DUF373 family)
MAEIKKIKSEPKEKSGFETSVIPVKYVDLVEDAFHAILALALLAIGIGAFFYSIERLITTAPFFPNGMIQGVNDILFIVIILEILRTVISRFTDGVEAFRRAIYEMGLNAGIVVALVFAFFLSKSALRGSKK